MNKILIVVLVILAIALLAPNHERAEPDPPEHRAFVESLSCEDVAGVRSRAFVTIRNTGETTIESPKVHVRIGSEVASGYLRPYPLRPGGIADAMIYNSSGGPEPCEVVSVTDRDGYQAVVI